MSDAVGLRPGTRNGEVPPNLQAREVAARVIANTTDNTNDFERISSSPITSVAPGKTLPAVWELITQPAFQKACWINWAKGSPIDTANLSSLD